MWICTINPNTSQIVGVSHLRDSAKETERNRKSRSIKTIPTKCGLELDANTILGVGENANSKCPNCK